MNHEKKKSYGTLCLFSSIAFMFFGCSSSKYPVNQVAQKETFVKVENQKFTKHKNFKKDKVSNFDYNRLGYYSQEGAYFGYFNQQGYYCDDTYYAYDNRLTYRDRTNRQGAFSPNIKHFRAYREDDGGGSYYYVPNRHHMQVRPHHPVHFEERHLGSGSYEGLTSQNENDRVIRD